MTIAPLSVRVAPVLKLLLLGLVLLLLALPERRPRGGRRITDTKMVIKNVERALVYYQSENVRCPPSLAALAEQRILSKVPLDGWGRPLGFICPGRMNPDDADIISAGRDRIFGTADDIRSWEL